MNERGNLELGDLILGFLFIFFVLKYEVFQSDAQMCGAFFMVNTVHIEEPLSW